MDEEVTISKELYESLLDLERKTRDGIWSVRCGQNVLRQQVEMEVKDNGGSPFEGGSRHGGRFLESLVEAVEFEEAVIQIEVGLTDLNWARGEKNRSLRQHERGRPS